MTSSVFVLIVEDEHSIVDVLEEALADGGYAVAVASSGEDAMAMLDTKAAECSALITDVNLSGQATGWEVARHARTIKEKLPVIYMTGASGNDWASQGVPNSQVIPKPFAVAQVVTAVSQLINAAVGLPQ